MTNSVFKQKLAFTLITLTVFLGLILLGVAVKIYLLGLTEFDLFAACGATGLLGAMITWDALIIQHYYRKKGEDSTPTTTTQ